MGRTKGALTAQSISKARCDRCGLWVYLREVDGTWRWVARWNVKPDPLTCDASGEPHQVVGRPLFLSS